MENRLNLENYFEMVQSALDVLEAVGSPVEEITAFEDRNHAIRQLSVEGADQWEIVEKSLDLAEEIMMVLKLDWHIPSA